MWKTLLLLGAGIGVGYLILPVVIPSPAAAAPPIPEGEELPPVSRMARDFRRACSDLNPLMRQLEAAGMDRQISVNEGIATLATIRRLV